MALTESPPEIDAAPAADEPIDDTVRTSQPTALERVVGSGQHAVIGRVFISGSLLFLLAALVISALSDVNAAADGDIFSVEAATRLLINHQIAVLLVGLLPLLIGIAICVVPKQVGSPSIAFPRAAAAAAWTWLGSAIVFVIAVAADGSYGGESVKVARLGNVAVGGLLVSLVLAVICVAVTVLTLRPAGMGLADVPFFSFSFLVAAGIWVLTFPSVMAHVVIGQITQSNPDTLLRTTYGTGVAWLFVQPALYLVLIPVAGFAVDAVATAVGGRQRFRGTVQVFIAAVGALSFGAWAQGRDGRSTIVWVAVTLAFGLPLLGLLATMADTLTQGRPKLISPLLSAFLSVLVALLGAGVGMVMTINTFGHGNLGTFDTASLEIAQLRIVFGAAIVGGVGALFYWSRQVTGAVVSDLPGKGIAPLLGLGAVLWGAPWLIQGLANSDDPELFAGIAAVGAGLLALGVLGVIASLAKAAATASRGDELLADVWGGGGTLEWAEPGDGPYVVESPYPVLDAAGKADS